MPPRSLLSSVSLISTGLLWSCATLLGIEDARCDPALDAECGDTASETVVGDGPDAPATEALDDAGKGAAVDPGDAVIPAADGIDSSLTALFPEDTLCSRYCSAVNSTCTDLNQQYASETACLAVCALLEPGIPGDAPGNTVQCRLARVELAVSTGEPNDYCSSAGPGGAGQCGSDCEGFCALMSTQCAELGPLPKCLEACSRVPDLSGQPPGEPYNTSHQSGDSLQCRLFHVSAASVDPIAHCAHAAGLSVCTAPP